MTPATIAEAVYEIGQAAVTRNEAEMGGADLGRSLAGQIAAIGGTREMLDCASNVEIKRTLQRLAKCMIPDHAAVASAALDAWQKCFARR